MRRKVANIPVIEAHVVANLEITSLMTKDNTRSEFWVVKTSLLQYIN